MTSDSTLESLLRVVREQAYEYISKPFLPKEAVEVAQRALEEGSSPPIEVVSALPHWSSCSSPAHETRRSGFKAFC